jgi:hypothetical protein
MRLRTFYTIAILLPLIPTVAIVAHGGGESQLGVGLPPGATAEWLYPRSPVRDLAAYGLVVLWLLRELRRRTPEEFARLLWRAPVAAAAASILLMSPLVLVHGDARDLLAEDGGWIVIRLLVRLLIGFAYVGLLVFVREQLRQGDALQADDGVRPAVRSDT